MSCWSEVSSARVNKRNKSQLTLSRCHAVCQHFSLKFWLFCALCNFSPLVMRVAGFVPTHCSSNVASAVLHKGHLCVTILTMESILHARNYLCRRFTARYVSIQTLHVYPHVLEWARSRVGFRCTCVAGMID